MTIKNTQLEDAGKAVSASNTPPETGAGKGAFFTKDVSGVTEGFYVDSEGNLVQLTNNGAINAEGGGGGSNGKALENTYENLTGATLAALTPVRSASGSLSAIDPSNEAHVNAILGLVKTGIPNSSSGLVCLEGLIENVTTSIAVDSTVYLSKSGGITSTPPESGVDGFVDYDFVVRLGQITKNASNPANKDFRVKIELVGQL